MTRFLVLFYGITAYTAFFAVFLYLIAFVTGVLAPSTVDTGLGTWGVWGNVALILLFGIQHTVMARSSFKEKLTRIIPPAIERSTFVLVTSVILFLIFRYWSPVEGTLWNIDTPFVRALIYGFAAVGWMIALISTFLINHFDLFGLRQTVLHFLGRQYTPVHFKKIAFYKRIRHPLMLGFLIAFWCTPTMSYGHLNFALAMSLYISVGILFEERELFKLHGSQYAKYRKETGMLLPVTFGG